MDKEIKLTDEEINDLNTIIKAVKEGKLTADELLSGIAAPGNNHNNNNHINLVQQLVGGFAAAQFALTIITVVTAYGKVSPEMSLSEIEDIKKETTLDRLIQIRNAAIAKNK